MKPISFIGLVIILVLTSCTLGKRVYMPGYHIEWNEKRQNHDTPDLTTYENVKPTTQIQNAPVQQPANEHINIYEAIPRNGDALIASADNSSAPMILSTSLHNSISISISTDECDVITLNNGVTIDVKVTEITAEEINYRKCDKPNGPIYTINKSKVFMIKYANGTEEVITADESSLNNSDTAIVYTNLKPEVFGVIGFVFSLTGLFVAGIPLGALAVVFGGTSLSRISNHPEKFLGKGLAILAIILGVIAIIGAMVFIII